MTVRAFWRGHAVHVDGDDWIYDDTDEAVADDPNRPCARCGLPNTPEGHDGCLGALPGDACCGHGKLQEFYLQLEGDRRLTLAELATKFVRLRATMLTTVERELRDTGSWPDVVDCPPWIIGDAVAIWIDNIRAALEAEPARELKCKHGPFGVSVTDCGRCRDDQEPNK